MNFYLARNRAALVEYVGKFPGEEGGGGGTPLKSPLKISPSAMWDYIRDRFPLSERRE